MLNGVTFTRDVVVQVYAKYPQNLVGWDAEIV